MLYSRKLRASSSCRYDNDISFLSLYVRSFVQIFCHKSRLSVGHPQTVVAYVNCVFGIHRDMFLVTAYSYNEGRQQIKPSRALSRSTFIYCRTEFYRFYVHGVCRLLMYPSSLTVSNTREMRTRIQLSKGRTVDTPQPHAVTSYSRSQFYRNAYCLRLFHCQPFERERETGRPESPCLYNVENKQKRENYTHNFGVGMFCVDFKCLTPYAPSGP